MPTPIVVTGSVGVGDPPVCVITAWAASRFTVPPQQDTALPSGSPDAGPVNSGPGAGNVGAWMLTLPDAYTDYWIAAQIPTGHIAWEKRPALPTPVAAPVSSVAGKTGAVTLVEGDIANLTTDLNTHTTNIASNTTAIAGKVDKSTATTKGDLFGASAASTPARIPVGANGTRPVADSAQTAGIAWTQPALTDDSDVVIATPTNNDVLTYETSSSKWKNKPIPGGSSTLAGDTDVVISSPANNDILTYETSSSKWKNKPNAGGGSTTVVGGTLLARTSYNPGTQQNKNPTTSLAAIDSTNLTISFTAPSSGAVDVVVESFAFAPSTGAADFMSWALVTHGTTTQVGSLMVAAQMGNTGGSGTQAGVRDRITIPLTSLTPGTVYSLDWAFKTTATTANQGVVQYGGTVGPAIMSVYDATTMSGVALSAAMNSDEAQASVISANTASDHFFGSSLGSKWTLEGTAPTVTITNSVMVVAPTGGAESGYWTPYAPSGAFRVEARVMLDTSNNQATLAVKDSSSGTTSTGNWITVNFNINSTNQLYITSVDSGAETVRAQVSYGAQLLAGRWIYLRLDRDASNNFTGYFSFDRASWITIGTYNKVLTVAKLGLRGVGSNLQVSFDFIDVVDGTVGAQNGLVTALAPPPVNSRLYTPAAGTPIWIPETNEESAGHLTNATSVGDAGNRADHFMGSALGPAWTPGGATLTNTVGMSVLNAVNSSTSTFATLKAPYTATGACRAVARVKLGDATSGQLWFGCADSAAGFAGDMATTRISAAGAGVTSFSAQSLDAGTQNTHASPTFDVSPYTYVFLRVARDASNNWTCSWSADRLAWVTLATFAKTFTVANLVLVMLASDRSSVDLVDIEL